MRLFTVSKYIAFLVPELERLMATETDPVVAEDLQIAINKLHANEAVLLPM